MKLYSYVIEHDLGLAPNPFGPYCTLAVCKTKIRRSGNLAIGDWIMGTGSKAIGHRIGKNLDHYVIYAMQVSEIIPLEHYWEDPRFAYKKPVMNGTLGTVYGDNFYHKDAQGKWIQEPSAHSHPDPAMKAKHIKTDTEGQNALIAETFYYFGQAAKKLPPSLQVLTHHGIGEHIEEGEKVTELIDWLGQFDQGIHDDPIGWLKHDQGELFS